MTLSCETRTTPRVGRKLQWPEKFLISLAEGTLARIEAARIGKEDSRAFIREAIEREIKRRSRQARPKP